jgi:polysaccharide biosynthesis/export protein
MNRPSLATLAVSGLFGAIALGQGSKPANPPVPEHIESPKEPAIKPDANGLPVDPRSYVIGAEDVLSIKVWRDESLSGAAVVRPDGKITRPLIGDIQASGLTPERLASQLREAYGDKLRNPDIVVEVLAINSKRYSITGAITRPARFPLIVPTRIFDALAQIEFKDFANKSDIIIIRDGVPRLHFNYKQYVKGKDKKAQEQNILLMNGDTIFVQE